MNSSKPLTRHASSGASDHLAEPDHDVNLPIRVLHLISPTGFYGAERWVYDIWRNASATGAVVEIAVTSEKDGERIELQALIEALGGTVHRILLKSRFDVSAVSVVRNLLQTRQIDVLHTHGYKSDIIGLFSVRGTFTHLVGTPHGYGIKSSLKIRTYVRLGQLALRRFDAVVPLSPALEREILDSGVSRQIVRLIRNGTNLEDIDVALQSSMPKWNTEKCRIGYVGQLIQRKRVHALIEVFEALAATRANVELVIAGDGAERKMLEEYVLQSQFTDRIEFLGFVEDRLALMKSFDMFVLTSAQEGIPRCLMEAMAMGVPVAAWSIPGVDDLVEDGVSGMLAPSGDLSALIARCSQIIDDSQLSRKLGEAAAVRIREHFSAKRMAVEYGELYRSLVDNSFGAVDP